MDKGDFDWQAVIADLEDYQRKRMLQHGRRIVPTLTPEDMLQPNDYPELENNAEFRYEEGVLAGVLSAKAALCASMTEKRSS